MDESRREVPKVSVIMCSYNGWPYIEEAVDTVLKQTYQNWELIISDDCSTDKTRQWLLDTHANNPRIRLFMQPKNLGYVANKNFAHRQASGQYLTQLDQDDRCHPERLERMVHLFNTGQDVQLAACNYRLIDNQGRVVREQVDYKEPIARRKPGGEYPFWYPSIMIRHEAFQKVGEYNAYFAGALGDDFYWTILANAKFDIYFLNLPLYDYRIHPNSITGGFRNMRKVIMPRILAELDRQRTETGTDWLEQGNMAALAGFENMVTNDVAYMSEQFRIAAARAFDQRHFSTGFKLLLRSVSGVGLSLSACRTFLYGCRAIVGLT